MHNFEILFLRKNVIILSLCTQRCYGRHNIFPKIYKHQVVLILLHGVISLLDVMSYDELCFHDQYANSMPIASRNVTTVSDRRVFSLQIFNQYEI